MLKKSLLLLTTTAILLPLQMAEARDANDKRERLRAEQAKQPTRRSSARQDRVRAAPRKQAKQQQTRKANLAPPQPNKTKQVKRRSDTSGARKREAERQQSRAAAQQEATRRSSTNNRRELDASSRQKNSQQNSQQRSPATRESGRVRDTGRTTSRSNASRRQTQVSVRGRSSVPPQNHDRRATRYDRDAAAYYDGARSRATARNDRADRSYSGRNNNNSRYRGGHRVVDPYQPHVNRRHYGGHRRYSSNNFYFGFGNLFGSYGYSIGYSNGYRPSYWDFYDPYNTYSYYSHWPYTRGLWAYRANWGWAHRHNHYHYGDYCPGFQHSSGGYYGYNSFGLSDYGYNNDNSDTVVGTLLGAVVGGIIGAEIDGGRNKTAGAVVGAVVGATIGNAATDNSVNHVPSAGVNHQPYSSSAHFDSDGRHVYEKNEYRPPEEVRTCMRYDYRGSDYVCTKWTVEYVYDDEEPAN
jgi:hypothetical protein